ncbi:MAG: hypothetical protein BWX61_00448 [Bacteroidetes bacterium ADurb.Bin035]|nr:MAG: hypothetical protein BWX61_00448 [Bacteroidetes bacterium ADurb.Bin035]
MNIGILTSGSLSTNAFFNLVSNSVPSSNIVKSAVKSVSNTESNPKRLSAVTILPVTLVPYLKPNSSPIATRTAGAVCTTTCFVGSLITSHTSSM